MALFTAALIGGLAQQNMQRGPVRSPHGSLNIACGNCHTSIGWKPLRAVPEFNHNRETKYPLKGMHTKVECAQCHANMIFRGDSPYGSSLYAIFSETGLQKQEQYNETIQSPAIIIPAIQSWWLNSLLITAILIIIIIALALIIIYFRRRRKRKS